MWGTHHKEAILHANERFIPTHVGNTVSRLIHAHGLSVHPHACGEHVRGPARRGLAIGSSPRMWGTRLGGVLYVVSHRFIPTHVGNTARGECRGRHRAVHPHACGEHIQAVEHEGMVCGSSPRMWGTLQHSRHSVLSWRFIPTHVGNTHAHRQVSAGLRFIPTHVGNTRWRIMTVR